MKTIYTSELCCPRIENGELLNDRLSDANGFVDLLRITVNDLNQMMVVFCDEESGHSHQEIAESLLNSFRLSGMNFKKVVIAESQKDFSSNINSSELVVVYCHDVENGIKTLNELKFKEMLKDYVGLLILPSLSAKLSSTKLVHSSESSQVISGLGIKDYSVHPHFNKSFMSIFDKELTSTISLNKELSKEVKVLAIDDDAFVLDDGSGLVVYGECYEFDNGKMKKICKNNKFKIVK